VTRWANAQRTYRRNLRAVLARAIREDWSDGVAWYDEAAGQVCRMHLTDAGYRLGLTHSQTAAIVAALSPRMRWEKNLHAARFVIEAAATGVPLAAPRGVSAFGRNIRKAERVALGADPEAVLSGPKVRAFWRALDGDPESVVVDVWMARAMTAGERDEPKSDRDYLEMARAVAAVAPEWEVTPAECQAVAWTVVRRESGAHEVAA
jgi:hypothetical protein